MPAPVEFTPPAAYTLQLPRLRRPIVVLGAGGIVRDAHLPAYRKAGFEVAAIFNRTLSRAEPLATQYGIPFATSSLDDAIAQAPHGAVFDLALMPEQYEDVLRRLPDGSAVLIQKPLGNDFASSTRVRDLCRSKELVAAVNTQLRFAPYVAAAREIIASGVIGELYDLEVRVQVNTPWQMFPHVLGLDRLEINMHSVHYIDLIRSFLGDPDGVDAVTERHPSKDIANTRSAILMHYPARKVRAVISTNHDHEFGPRHEESYVKWEGTEGAVRAQMGLLLDYPSGGPDVLEMVTSGSGWTPVPFEGSWFPDAFIGSMSALQRYVEGSVDSLPTSVDDAHRTMAVVEAAYRSAEAGGVRPPY